jgi:uncharacterized protein YbjT (DUF2867 family)
VVGASGLVGQQVLAELLNDSAYSAVHTLSRRPLGLGHPRLVEHLIDFTHIPALPHIDDAWIALGTTIKQAGSQEAFQKVDLDAVVASAAAAKAAGAQRLGVVSALGANATSRVFYNRVKGLAEQQLQALGFASLVIARPSLLLGDRSALGQATRPGERIAAWASGVLGKWLPARVRPITAPAVAHALVTEVQRASSGVTVLESGAMQP